MNSAVHTSDVDPSVIRGLTAEQRQRLTEVLDQYLRALDEGVPPSPDALVAAHPDLTVPLQVFLRSLDCLHGMAAGFGGVPGTGSGDARLCGGSSGRLGDFVLGREIGRGGMGVVYEAQQLSLDRRVALKVLPFAAVFDARQIARFKNEAQAAAQLHHPHIVPVFAVGMERGVHYYAMQFIEGQSLDQAIAQLRVCEESAAWGAAVSALGRDLVVGAPDASPVLRRSVAMSCTAGRRAYIQTVVQLGIQAAEALHAAHEYGVVHRDIKPSNLLLDHDGKLWITDFGLARFRSDSTLTQSGDVVGTLRYMSPEQASGASALVDQRTDIYSLAVTLYELLTLPPARDGSAAPDLLRAVDAQEPPRLRRVSPQIPPDLETVVRKGMARDRDERYATAQLLADDLRHVLAGEPTVARPLTLAERAGKWTLRHKRLAGAVACLVLLAGVGCAASALLIARQTIKADRNYARAQKNFRAARDAVDRFGTQLAQRLADVPGAAQVRRELLAETLQYYRDFAAQAEGEPDRLADLALTYSKIGTLADDTGSPRDAIAAHEVARDLYARLAAAEPGARDHVRHQALCANNLARALARAGRVDQAFQAHGEAIRIQQRLLHESTGARRFDDLALSHNNLGLLQAETGDIAAASQSFREAIRLQEQAAVRDSHDSQCCRHLAASYNNLGGLSVHRDPPRAIESFRRAVELLTHAVAEQPADLGLQNDLALTFANLGSTHARLNECAAAENAYQQAIQMQTTLVRRAPGHLSYCRNLSLTANNHGLMQSRLGQTQEAEQSFRQALTRLESLVAQDPGDVTLQSSLAGVCNNLGMVLEAREQLAQAAAAFQQAVDHQQVAYAEAATVTRYRTFLSKHYFNYGRVLRKLGQADEAIRIALARRELWPQTPRQLLSVAEELAQAADLLTDKASGAVTRAQAVTLAVETLQQAIAAGLVLPPDFDTRQSFAAIRNDTRVLKLVGK